MNSYKKLGVLILAAYIAFKDLNGEINLLAYIIIGLVLCNMFVEYKYFKK